MTKHGHNAVGACCALGSLAFPHEHPWFIMLGVYLGAGAPDWLEVSWYDVQRRCRASLIEHRTWTHWLPAWILLISYAWYEAQTESGFWILFGFAVGGLVHLLVDWPNPTGIPIMTPLRRSRHSLKLWRSSEHTLLISMVFLAGAFGLHYYMDTMSRVAKSPAGQTFITGVKQAFAMVPK